MIPLGVIVKRAKRRPRLKPYLIGASIAEHNRARRQHRRHNQSKDVLNRGAPSAGLPFFAIKAAQTTSLALRIPRAETVGDRERTWNCVL